MTWIDLGNPLPKEFPERYDPIRWETGEIIDLPYPQETIAQPFIDVINSRLSLRHFGVVDDSQLGEFLWHA